MTTDRDGKSKTASAVDRKRYPEQNEVEEIRIGGQDFEPDDQQIAERAHQLWIERGYREGSAEQDWFDAREELRAKLNSEKTRKIGDGSGSVQP